MPAKSRPKTEPQLALALEAVEGPQWAFRASRRVRRLQIRVSPWQGVEVVMPPRTSARRVREFVARNRDWVDRAWAEIRAEYPEAGRMELPERICLPATEEEWRVQYRHSSASRWRELPGGILQVSPGSGDFADRCGVLRGWLADRARRALVPQLERLAREHGLQHRSVQIRSQRTRWGSCSARGIVSLNCKLLFCEPSVVRYLLVHELSHLRHLNHGKRFWALVASLEPRYRTLDARLEQSWKRVPAWVEIRK